MLLSGTHAAAPAQHLGQILTGGEVLTRPGQHDHAHAGILPGLGESGSKSRPLRRVERVLLLRPIHRQTEHTIIFFRKYGIHRLQYRARIKIPTPCEPWPGEAGPQDRRNSLPPTPYAAREGLPSRHRNPPMPRASRTRAKASALRELGVDDLLEFAEGLGPGEKIAIDEKAGRSSHAQFLGFPGVRIDPGLH